MPRVGVRPNVRAFVNETVTHQWDGGQKLTFDLLSFVNEIDTSEALHWWLCFTKCVQISFTAIKASHALKRLQFFLTRSFQKFLYKQMREFLNAPFILRHPDEQIF